MMATSESVEGSLPPVVFASKKSLYGERTKRGGGEAVAEMLTNAKTTVSTTTTSTLSPSDILVSGGLGSGGFGAVVEVAVSTSAADIARVGCRLAMKCMNKQMFCPPKKRKQIENEIHVLTKVEASPFLLRCHLAFETDSMVFLVTDLLSGGDLFFRLDQLAEQGHDGLPEEQARSALAEVAMGLCHLHSRGFIHRDIKVENIMVDGDGHVKLVDFGLVSALPEEDGGIAEIPVSVTGSLIYMSPELLKRKIGGRFTDWWAFGILSYELLTGRSPWSTLSDTRKIQKEIVGLSVGAPFGVSAAAGDFVVSLLRKDYHLRLGTGNDREVLSSPFFTGIDWDALEDGKTPPPFTSESGQVNVEEADAEYALEEYAAMAAVVKGRSTVDLGLLHVPHPPPEVSQSSTALPQLPTNTEL